MNDSFRTNVCVRFLPETIACACIFLSARQLKVKYTHTHTLTHTYTHTYKYIHTYIYTNTYTYTSSVFPNSLYFTLDPSSSEATLVDTFQREL